MRKYILLILTGALVWLIAARSVLPDPAAPAFAPAQADEYNILSLTLPAETETAGSGMIGEITAYYLSRQPTAKNALTGVLRGKNLVLICADDWSPVPADRTANPALSRLARESARLTQVWRPDWYQQEEGQLFALLSGLMPTRIRDRSAMTYIGEQNTFLPFALPRALSREGYACRAVAVAPSCAAGMTALGFSETAPADGRSASTIAEELLIALDETQTPGFFFAQWPGDGEEALSLLLEGIDGTAHRTDTALCLLTADADSERAQLYIWGAGLSGASSDLPCSELDLTPTLLNLFGVPFDSRLLAGRDVFAPPGAPGTASSLTPLVTLYGSAFSDWVTDIGRYDAAADELTASASLSSPRQEEYVRTTSLLCYHRYVFSRRVIESDYFRLLLFGRE